MIEKKNKGKVQPLSDFYTSDAYIPKADRTLVFRPKTVIEAQKQEEEPIFKYETFEELEKAVASEYGRKHIGYPCDEAQDININNDYTQEYYNHLETCSKCKELLDKIESKITRR